ncbi:ATP-binding cassette domain-containing protein [Roseovarius sp.]|uniref:ATP-binding cassette domain-containing protein n=1 Tax=Roseovarius sp. TaxID=1486281 RepID=UPI003A96F3F8
MRDLVMDIAPAEIIANSSLLEVRDLSFEAGGKRLIQDVSLAIPEGRRTLIMGANGAGKSLLLRLLHGLLPPSSGQILWQGAAPDRAARRAQAMVFQRPVMLRRSVLANLNFALSVHGIRGTRRAAEVERALDMAGLTDLARRPARILSGGEQQRLALARALICKPRLLFLDEPTSSLDPASTQRIEDLINAAHARGVTIVMVTHDLGQARRMGDAVIFLHSGQVAESGPVDQVLCRPRSEAARAWTQGRLYTSPTF